MPTIHHTRDHTCFTILLVEDNSTDVEMFLRAMREAFPSQTDEPLEVVVTGTAENALRCLEERTIDLVVTDIRLPGMSGIELLSRIEGFDRPIPVVVISWVNTIDMAVEAMRHGALDCIVKPFQTLDLAMRLHRVMRLAELVGRSQTKDPTPEVRPFHDIIGISPAIRDVTRMIESVARVPATALIVGETGTGKELIAKAIHERSDECRGPFQVVDCTMFSEGTAESELFGHVRGAFTGAVSDKPGLIESGSHGTVFLDEIAADIPLSLQAKLMRVLEEGEVRAVGSVHHKKVNVRFIAATNQDLAQKVKKGEFRKDLYYRLNVMVIRVPPLRERREDIPVLARHFVTKYAKDFGRPVWDIDASAVNELVAYPWPGNVRELRNVIEQAIMLAQGDRLRVDTIKGLLQDVSREHWSSGDYLHLPYAKAKKKVLEGFNRRYISFQLDSSAGNVTRAAMEAGLPRSYFHQIMRRYWPSA